MELPDSYALKPSAIPAYFDAIKNAQPPERFSQKFLEGLGFKSTNDRLFIGILKDLGFLDSDGKPQQRYFEYLDPAQSERILAESLQEAYSGLFAVRTNANELSAEEVKGKLRTLYAGNKSDLTVERIAKTFTALTEIADFAPRQDTELKKEKDEPQDDEVDQEKEAGANPTEQVINKLSVQGLQYHINIVLPDTRDQAVYDAIFKSMRDHLG